MGNNEEKKVTPDSSDKNVNKQIVESKGNPKVIKSDLKNNKELKAADKTHKKAIKSARPKSGTFKKLDLNDFSQKQEEATKVKKENVSDMEVKLNPDQEKIIQERKNIVNNKKTSMKLSDFDVLSDELKDANAQKNLNKEDIVQGEKQTEENVIKEIEIKEDKPSIESANNSPINQEVPVKKHKGWKIFGILLGMVLVLAGGAYSAVSYYYTDKFIEGTSINGIDCSGKTALQVETEMAGKVEQYKITVYSRNQQPQTINGKDIDYKYMSNGDILNLLTAQKPYLWLTGYFKDSNLTAQENIVFSHELLQEKMDQLECAKEENQVTPENAYISYENSEFAIVPETQGSSLLNKKAFKELEEAVTASSADIDFEQLGLYETASVTKDDPKLMQAVEAYNKYSKAQITFVVGDQKEVLDGNIIKDWLETSADGVLYKDEDAFRSHIQDYVTSLAEKYNTVGEGREFTATSGRTVTVYGYAYGWEIDEAAEVEKIAEEINNGETVEREPIWSMTANSHDKSDVGNTYIEVDLGLQQMYYYIDGEKVFESPFISGKPDGEHDTPEGIYLLYNKESPSILKGEVQSNGKREYETQVSYWMAFNGGIGFHDATWQYYGFGGDLYKTLGSHGCINLPLDAAAQLYSIIRYGDPIVCFY